MTNSNLHPEAGAPYPETCDIHSSTDEYAARFKGSVGAWMLSVQERIFLKFLGETGAKTVLDVGGGHGQLAVPMCRDGYDVTVLGSSPEGAHRIQQVIDTGRCRYTVGNMIALPFPDKSFDVVVSFRIVMHCGQWPQLVKELCRVARKAVIIDYPTSQSVNSIAPALFDAKKKLEGNTRFWRLFKHAEIDGEFARNGFRPTARTGQFFFPMVVHRVLKLRPLAAVMEAPPRWMGLTRRWGSPVIVRMSP